MQLTVALVLAITVVTVKEISAAGRECEADHQCANGYCYRDTGVCTACTDCATYLRSPPKWKACARGHQDCGDCVDGFEVEVLVDGSTRDYCIPKKTQGNGQNHVDQSTHLWLLIGVPLGVIVMAGVVLGAFYRGVKRRTPSGSVPDLEAPPPPPHGNNHESPPPSYDSSVPLLEGVSAALVNSVMVIEKEGNILQQAVPFTNPFPPYGCGGAAEEDPPGLTDQFNHNEMNDPALSPQELADEEGACVNSPPQWEDEDTMPSDWTPENWPLASNSPQRIEEEQEPAPNPSPWSSSSSLSNAESQSKRGQFNRAEMCNPAQSPQELTDEGADVHSPAQVEDENAMLSEWTLENWHLGTNSSQRTEDEQEPAPNTTTWPSSNSSLSNPEELVDGNNGMMLNDSGVSTSGSHQSGLSSIDCDNGVRSLEAIPLQGSAVGSLRAILQRCHSDEDISSLAELRANKRQRCDSGSGSAQSLQPF